MVTKLLESNRYNSYILRIVTTIRTTSCGYPTITQTLPTIGRLSTNNMRILVLGAHGMLGTDLLQEWQSDELIPADVEDADLRNFAAVEKLVARVRPEWIVLTAAYTDVDGCERNPELAFAVNA